MVTVEEAIISCSSTGVRGDVVYYPVSGDNMQNVIFREAMNKRVGENRVVQREHSSMRLPLALV